MCSIIIEDVFDKLKEENKILTEELAFIRERMKLLIDFKFSFDLYSNKIKQSLESNEWQKLEEVLKKINEFLDSREMSKNNVEVDVNTCQTQPQELQEVSDSSVGAPIILLNVIYFSI